MESKFSDEFVVYKGITYRAKSYTNDYELFDKDDIDFKLFKYYIYINRLSLFGEKL